MAFLSYAAAASAMPLGGFYEDQYFRSPPSPVDSAFGEDFFISAPAPSYHDAFNTASRDLTLLTILPAAPDCPRCSGLTRNDDGHLKRPVTAQDAEKGHDGLVCYLESESHYKQVRSCILKQEHVNSGAFKHPCLILLRSKCSHLVFCAPMTSWGGKSIKKKYSRASKATQDRVFYEWLAFAGDRDCHNTIGELTMQGKSLPKKSYVHLDKGYWVEWDNLSFHGGEHYGARYLDQRSTELAKWAYAVAENHRQIWGSQSKLPSRTPSPASPVRKSYLTAPPRIPSSPAIIYTPIPAPFSPSTPTWRLSSDF